MKKALAYRNAGVVAVNSKVLCKIGSRLVFKVPINFLVLKFGSAIQYTTTYTFYTYYTYIYYINYFDDCNENED
jgi:hypothetical protein